MIHAALYTFLYKEPLYKEPNQDKILERLYIFEYCYEYKQLSIRKLSQVFHRGVSVETYHSVLTLKTYTIFRALHVQLKSRNY